MFSEKFLESGQSWAVQNADKRPFEPNAGIDHFLRRKKLHRQDERISTTITEESDSSIRIRFTF